MKTETTTSTHTPGDWTLQNRTQIVALHSDEDGDHETLIAEIYDEHDWHRANARLIKAAPEMLAALIKLANESERRAGVPKAVIAHARAVIAKAEGSAL